MNQSNTQKTRLVNNNELPMSCPTSEDKTWNLHPKVFLKFNDNGEACCEYCGTKFKLSNQ